MFAFELTKILLSQGAKIAMQRRNPLTSYSYQNLTTHTYDKTRLMLLTTTLGFMARLIASIIEAMLYTGILQFSRCNFFTLGLKWLNKPT